MLVTRREGPVPAYLGVDLTDGRAATPRPVDVCGLTPAGGGFEATFWTWAWRAGSLESVIAELRAASCALIDGPQALARPGASVRQCERLTGAPGKTPDRREAIRGPYAGFVRSSVDFFRALSDVGIPISLEGFVGGVGECYPGSAWKALLPGIAKKTTAPGVRQRVAILERLGVRLSPHLTHDQLDAALGALLAAAADGRVAGLRVDRRGLPLVRRADGDLEEGPLAVPVPGEQVLSRLRDLASSTHPPHSQRRAAPGSRSAQELIYPCPIPGCAHRFRGSRGGWDAHAASLRTHPAWLAGVRDPEARKAAFRNAFPEFFQR